jgi:hypothetical protein
VFVIASAPLVEAMHTHKSPSRDCSICHVAHVAPIISVKPAITTQQQTESILAVLNVEHRPFFLTENICVRPPPYS